MKTKQCVECRKEDVGPKFISEFCKNKRNPDGLQYNCREHTRAQNRRWAKENPEKNRIKGTRFRENNPVASRRISFRSNLKRFYGLTENEYSGMFDAQNGKCAVCELHLVSQLDETRINSKGQGHAPNNFARVDHCHTTGEIRGLLCFSCNVGLGKFKDDEELLLRAVRYLRNLRNRTSDES